jgi:hypothetical protein
MLVMGRDGKWMKAFRNRSPRHLRHVYDGSLPSSLPATRSTHIPPFLHLSINRQCVPGRIGTTHTHLKWMAPRADNIKPMCVQGAVREERSPDGFVLLHCC